MQALLNYLWLAVKEVFSLFQKSAIAVERVQMKANPTKKNTFNYLIPAHMPVIHPRTP